MPKEVFWKIRSFLSKSGKSLLICAEDVTIRIATLPYYRLYHFNTIEPLKKSASLANESLESPRLLRAVKLWRERKITELQFISISCAILAAAFIGAFSWSAIDEAFWLTHGLWHGGLVLSILGILLSASEVMVLHVLGPLPHWKNERAVQTSIKRYIPLLLSDSRDGFKPRRKMIFTWQCPMMFMSYSVCAFLAGLTILVCTPLIRRKDEWTAGCDIAVVYLTVCVIAGTTFVFCTYWVYHYVDLDFDSIEDEHDYEQTRMGLETAFDHNDDDYRRREIGLGSSFLNRFESRISHNQ